MNPEDQKEPVNEPVKENEKKETGNVVPPVNTPPVNTQTVNVELLEKMLMEQKATNEALASKLQAIQKNAAVQALNAAGAVDVEVAYSLIQNAEDPAKAIEELKASKSYLFKSTQNILAGFQPQNKPQSQPTIKAGESLSAYLTRLGNGS